MVIDYKQFLKGNDMLENEKSYSVWKNETLLELDKDRIYFENMSKIDDARIDILFLKIDIERNSNE